MAEHPLEQRIRERMGSDLQSDGLRPLPEYLGLFPEADALRVARAWCELSDPAANSSDRDFDGRPGSRLAHYVVERELGRGGQGIVYLATDTKLKRRVALKVLTGLGADARDLLQRFRREAEVASKLDHPGICTVLDTRIKGPLPYIAMRYVEGETLAERIARGAELSATTESIDEDGLTLGIEFEDESATEVTRPAARASSRSRKPPSSTGASRAEIRHYLDLFVSAARALDAAHEAGVIHRDIKPGNIMIGPQGDPVLLDFGLARDDSDEGAPTLTETGDLFGTPAYMSPEQLSAGRIRMDGRTDIYSLGVALFECLAGRRPFEAPTREALYQAILTREAPRLRSVCRSAPKDLETVLGMALAKDRQQRYETAEDLARDLEAVRDSRPIRARAIGPLGRLTRFARRRPMAATVIALLMVGIPVLAGLSGYIYAHRDDIVAQERMRLFERAEDLLATGFFELNHVGGSPAVATFDRALALLPDSLEARCGRALAMRAAGDAAAALDFVRRIERASPSVRRLEALLLEELGRTEEAESLRKELPTAGGEAFDHYLLAQLIMAGAHGYPEATSVADAAYNPALDAMNRALALSERPRKAYYLAYAHLISHLDEQERLPGPVEALGRLWPDDPWGWYWTAVASRGDPVKTLELIERAHARNPIIPLQEVRPGLLQKAGRVEEAFEAAKDWARKAPRNPRAARSVATGFLNLGDPENALRHAERAMKLGARDPITKALRASALFALARHEEGVPFAREAMSESDEPLRALRLTMAHSLVRVGRGKEALALLAPLLAEEPDAPDLMEARGMALLASHRPSEAVPLFEKLVAAHPETPRLLGNLVAARLGAGDARGALEAGEEAMELGLEDPMMLVNLAQVNIQLRRHDRAREIGVRLEGRGEEIPQVHGLRGDLALIDRRYEEAIEHFQRSIEIAPTPAALSNLSQAYLRLGRQDEALDALGQASELGHPTASYAHAVRLGQAGRTDEAIAAYRKTIEQHPDHAEAHCNLADWLRRRKEYGEAIALLKRGHALGSAKKGWRYPSDLWLLNLLREAVMDAARKKEHALVVARIREILALSPSSPDTRRMLARALSAPDTTEAVRDVPEALRLAVEVRDQDPTEPRHHQTLAAILEIAGFPAAALRAQERAVALLAAPQRKKPGLLSGLLKRQPKDLAGALKQPPLTLAEARATLEAMRQRLQPAPQAPRTP